MRLKLKQHEAGFTLIEAVIVIAITGIVAAVVAVFIVKPVQGYFDTVHRAELSDTADAAVRRMGRDVQSALANSVRLDATGKFLEFVPIKTAGRYRADFGVGGAGDPLRFDVAADNTFDVLGPAVTVANGDSVVIYNLDQAQSNVYQGTNRRMAAAFGTVNTVTFTATASPFPMASPGSRFHIVGTAVSYVCQPNAVPANGFLLRYSGYAIQAAQPVATGTLDALAGVTKSILATNVTTCDLTYSSGTLQSLGLVVVRLGISNGAPILETVDVLHQINVNNTP